MATQEAAASEAQSNGGTATLAEHVLKDSTHGAGYFYPATAAGTPLALLGFATSLGLLSMGNAEWYSLNALLIVAPVAFGFGAVAMILAGMWDFRGGNGLAAMWETAYGCFWLSVGLQLAIFGDDIAAAAGSAGAADAFGSYLLMWALITAGLSAGMYYVARPAFTAFALLTVVFLLLGFANMAAPGDTADTLRQIGGWVGIVNALVAFYLSFALMINAAAGRNVAPVWPYPYKR
jgi:hypothetical protein